MTMATTRLTCQTRLTWQRCTRPMVQRWHPPPPACAGGACRGERARPVPHQIGTAVTDVTAGTARPVPHQIGRGKKNRGGAPKSTCRESTAVMRIHAALPQIDREAGRGEGVGVWGGSGEVHSWRLLGKHSAGDLGGVTHWKIRLGSRGGGSGASPHPFGQPASNFLASCGREHASLSWAVCAAACAPKFSQSVRSNRASSDRNGSCYVVFRRWRARAPPSVDSRFALLVSRHRDSRSIRSTRVAPTR